jgi:sugar transferase EpsL
MNEKARKKTLYLAVKRILDLTLAAAGLIVAAPVLLTIAAVIRATMGPPVFFRQARPGLRGRPFVIYKFRTMRDSPDEPNRPNTDAQRLTKMGRLLRDLSLDELPALINVIKGEMSLVGPRPLLMEYLERYSPQQARRHEAKPGVTGWAQINGRNALPWEDRFEHDVWYVDNRSLTLDLKILALTLLKVWRREGISADKHATMPEFLGGREESWKTDKPAT